jgi:hypothetical protein
MYVHYIPAENRLQISAAKSFDIATHVFSLIFLDAVISTVSAVVSSLVDLGFITDTLQTSYTGSKGSF